MKPIVLVNASAGTAVQFSGEELCARISRAFNDAGRSCDVHPIAPKGLSAALDQAATERRPVIVAGGDGSVSAAVQRFAGTGIPLGVLPFGTYNLLANDLGMSTDLDEAVRQLAAADERRIDIGKVGRRRFHTLGGLGYFSRVARQRAEVRKSISNKVVGAAVAAFRSFTRGGSLDVEIDDGTRRESFRTPAILITNNLMEPDSWRRRRLDAGVFEVNVVRGDVPFGLLRGGLAAFMGSWRESAEIATLTAPVVTLTFRRPRVFLSLDGEVTRPRTPLRFEIMPRALTVLAAPAPQAEAATAEPAAALT
ncbi:MAG TPA: diacylglycerol kinase family protein [Beijerinckiaceae bacterium]|jgi:diacylglycerol kinase family enzyme